MKNENIQMLPQLFMRLPDMEHLPKMLLPSGFSVHTHVPGCEGRWETIAENAFGEPLKFADCIINNRKFPEYVIYINKNGVDIATAAGAETELFPGEGFLHMVARDPAAAGQGAGKMAVTAVLHFLKDYGYRSVWLCTDDFRLSAVRMYLSLGFKPELRHESHEMRWRNVLGKLGCDIQSAKML